MEQELKGWDLWAVKAYVHGLVFLILVNVLCVLSTPPTFVWFVLNGVGVAAILLSRRLSKDQTDHVGVSDQPKRLSKK